MVADDQEYFRVALVQLLIALGHTVVEEAADGEAAVIAARSLHPDVVIMDLRMPGMDGIEAARAIAELAPATGIVMLSAYEDPALIQRARQAGAAEYVLKGGGAAPLLEAIERATNRAR